MTIKEAIEIMREHNQWRRGEEAYMQSPADIGVAIEVLCKAAEEYELSRNPQPRPQKP